MKIRELLLNFTLWLHKIWDKLSATSKKLIPIAVKIVDALKTFNESEAANLIEHVMEVVIPGEADDIIISKVRKFMTYQLPILLVELKIMQNITDLEGDKEKVVAILNAFIGSPIKDIYLKSLAGKALQLMEDGKFDFNDAVQLTTEAFKLLHPKEDEAA